MTVYEFIQRAKAADLWDGFKVLSSRANTLERYSQIYSILLQEEPHKSRGYQQRLLKNPAGVSALSSDDIVLLKWAIHEMEAILE